MKYAGVIDCGTTNSRFSVVDECGDIIASGAAKIGVKDTAIHGTKEVLKKGLQALLEDTLSSAGIDVASLKFVMSSGMITSELGLMELPHLPAPVGLEDLAGQLVKLPRGADLDLGVDVYLIRGIKNRLDPERGASLSDAKLLDFMRGEETQMMGLLSLYGGASLQPVVNLASHTKYIVIDPTIGSWGAYDAFWSGV